MLDISARYVRDRILLFDNTLSEDHYDKLLTSLCENFPPIKNIYAEIVQDYFPEISTSSNGKEVADAAYRLIQAYMVLGKTDQIVQETIKKFEKALSDSEQPTLINGLYNLCLEYGIIEEALWVGSPELEGHSSTRGSVSKVVTHLKENVMCLDFVTDTHDEDIIHYIVMLNNTYQHARYTALNE